MLMFLLSLPFFFFLQECDEDDGNEKVLTTAQKKAQRIMESFENPFRMVKFKFKIG